MTRRSDRKKNQAAAALARRRAAKLSPEQRRESARRAALARWYPADALAAAETVDDLSALMGGLPDTRRAEAILEDLRTARRARPVST